MTTEPIYGVTWATPDHSTAQTGYVFATIRQARRMAKRGPARVEALGYQVDGMCEHFPTPETPLYGRIETEGRTFGEIRSRR